MRLTRLTTALALAASAGTTSIALAPTASAEVGRLTFSTTTLSTGSTTSVTLTCEPTGGTHPDAEAACQDLITVNGDISQLPSIGGCAGVSIPVIDSAWGFWSGRFVHYRRQFDNAGCGIVATGGHVFHF